MATTVRASSTATSASATSIAPAAPTGTAAGDLVIVVVSSNNAVTLSDNNGSTPFTKDDQTQEAEEGQTVAIFSRRIVAGDPSSYSFSSSGAASRITAVAVTFQSPHPSTIYDVVPLGNPQTGAGGSTTITASSITTVTANAINCAVFCADGASNAISGLPSGYTVEQNSGDERIAFTDKVIVVPGATGNQTATQAASDGWIGYQFAIADIGQVGNSLPMRYRNARGGPLGLHLLRRVPQPQTSGQTVVITTASNMAFTETTTLVKTAVVSPSDHITFTETTTLVKTAKIAAADNITFTEAATLVKTALLSPSSNLRFTETVSLVATKVLVPTTHITFTEAAALVKTAIIQPVANISFTETVALVRVSASGTARIITGFAPAILRLLNRWR